MQEIKNVVICGIGAIGSIYANLINEFDSSSLRILVDENRLQKYKSNPQIFNGKELKFNYILPNDTSFKADLIIIATKNNGLNEAIQNIKNFVHQNTIIISLLNGITSEEIISKTYGWKHVLHSYFIGHSAMRKNNVITHDGVGTIVFGIKNEHITDKNDEITLKNYFDKVGINYQIPKDIQYSMWVKFMLNVSVNQTSAILKLTFGQMQTNEKFLTLMNNIMLEIQALAKAHGVKNSENLINDAVKDFNKMIPEGKTSMLQDIEAGRKTEVDIFSGIIINLGEKYNIPTPYNKIIKEFIEVIQ